MVTPHDAGLAVLEVKGIGKEFGAIRALHGVDLSPGEVVGNVAAEISAQAARAERHGAGPVLAADRHRFPPGGSRRPSSMAPPSHLTSAREQCASRSRRSARPLRN
ncbi:hypothetical protein DXU07_25445 [Bradyrhizobium elkanii]|nr:hypothetical protein [Bradyrhizobium elkanii]NWL68528.1 hypothetical protein [Bradyrhizobium elkanii]QOZ19917.1 hypothetical protein XI02_36360 [Bradyrhizobium sp. CCBAU 21365]RYM16342.1 hypothetical protein EWH13_41900 [Bradyrhizobium elkanii]